MSEMSGITKGAAYIERTTITSPKNIRRTKKAIKKAFKTQAARLGFSMVKSLSPCPTNWKMPPVDACKWLKENATTIFPLKVIKDNIGNI